MRELQGKYTTAKVFTDNIEEGAINQIIVMLDQEWSKNAHVRIMPDCHQGAGCTIGTTMKIEDKIVPNLVGVDIGCGMLTIKLGVEEINLPKLDEYIRNNIPHGFNINLNPKTDYKEQIESLLCFRDIPKSSREFNRALGSLGGGNHFIEVNRSKEGALYLVIHSGSRNLGKQVATYYQNRAYDYHNGLDQVFENEKNQLINEYKSAGKRKEIQKALKELKKKHQKECTIPKDLCYLEGHLMESYLHDMKIVQSYANLNREIMARRITEECLGLTFELLEKFQTIHNYIDLEHSILRKGAVSAQEGELLLIPINMRDGSLLCIGKGNKDWNCSAPHGAGRLMSRSVAKDTFKLDDYKKTMEGIYSSSIKESTLDECPMTYKPIDEIVSNVKDSVDIVDIIKPIYNFKS